ncbi:50S ribosomal protein L4 [Candidatus Gottesmanbacteria bacterium]|nr:50S ribosomal protein L4 [Candidatus Gottesmanbacteria bacterium]
MDNNSTIFTYDIYNPQGKKISQGRVESNVVSDSLNKLMAQAVRVYKENIRQKNSSTKERGEVAGSTRKIYQQKGTGRARHGDIKAPIFIGGGIVFGPKPSTKKLGLSKNMAQKAFLAAILSKIRSRDFIAIEGLTDVKPKTKLFDAMFNNIFTNNENLLFINSGMDNLLKGARNIKRVTLTPYQTVNIYDVLSHPKIAIQKESIVNFLKRLNITGSEIKTTKKNIKKAAK